MKRKTVLRRIEALQAMLDEIGEDVPRQLTSDGKYAELYGYIGRAIENCLDEKHIKIAHIAKQTGLSRATIHRCINGYPITIHNLYTIAQGLGVSPFDLLPSDNLLDDNHA